MRWPRRKPKHIHDWYVRATTIVGWSIVRCRTCGKEDLS